MAGVGWWVGGGWSSGWGESNIPEIVQRTSAKRSRVLTEVPGEILNGLTSVRGTQLGIIALPPRFFLQWADPPDLYTDQASLVQWDQP